MKRNRNYQNSSCNGSLNLIIDFKVLHKYSAITKNEAIQNNKTQIGEKPSQTIVNLKKYLDLKLLWSNFQNNKHTFQSDKFVPRKATNPIIWNSNKLIIVIESVAIFIQNIRSNFNNQLKESSHRFKYFIQIIMFYIESTLGKRQFGTAIIQTGINDLQHHKYITFSSNYP